MEGSDRGECSSPSLVVYDPHGDRVSKQQEKDKSNQAPPPVANGRGGDSMLFHILSPIEEMSSPECSDRGEQSKPGTPASGSEPLGSTEMQEMGGCHGSDANKAYSQEDEEVATSMRDGCEEAREEEESLISPKELDSGIHLGFSNSMDSDATPCPDAIEADKMLSQRLKLQNIGCSDSFESVSSASLSLPSLDANDTLDSLETHIHSSHSDLHSPPPDIHDDFDSTNSTLTGKGELAEDDWKVADEKPTLSRSSSEDTLRSEEDEVGEGLEGRELSIEEFLDQIHTRTSSMTEEEEVVQSDESGTEQDGSSEKCQLQESSQDVEADGISREEESENRDHVSLNLEFHPRSFYKRSRSSDDFRSIRDGDPAEDPGSNSDSEEIKVKSKGKSHRNGKFTSNRFIRYDSLPLVVEVYEADSNSPSFSPVEYNKSRFIYDSGQDSESPNDNKGSPRHKVHNQGVSGKQRQSTKASKAESINQARQTSVESTDSTLPKSTPMSSGPTTPDWDRKHPDCHNTISSESENSPDTSRRDNVQFTRQLLMQRKEYHQQEGIRPMEGSRMRSHSTSTSDTVKQKNRLSSNQSQRESSPRRCSLPDEDKIPAGYKRLHQHGKVPVHSGKSARGADYKDKIQDEEDDSCGVSNRDEIVGLLSEQDVLDSSDDDEDEDEEFEDANTTLTDDINGNGDSNHNEDIEKCKDTAAFVSQAETRAEDVNRDKSVHQYNKEDLQENDSSERSDCITPDAMLSCFRGFRSRNDTTDDICRNADAVPNYIANDSVITDPLDQDLAVSEDQASKMSSDIR